MRCRLGPLEASGPRAVENLGAVLCSVLLAAPRLLVASKGQILGHKGRMVPVSVADAACTAHVCFFIRTEWLYLK